MIRKSFILLFVLILVTGVFISANSKAVSVKSDTADITVSVIEEAERQGYPVPLRNPFEYCFEDFDVAAERYVPERKDELDILKDYVLIGVSAGEDARAVIQRRSDSSTLFLREGDVLSGEITLKSVEAKNVIFSAFSSERKMFLDEPEI